jgi:siroheme synthase
MGMSERERIADELIRSGRPASTPAAVVHWATTARQQVVRTTLEGLVAVDLPAPSVIVVGPVAGLDVGQVAGLGFGPAPDGAADPAPS